MYERGILIYLVLYFYIYIYTHVNASDLPKVFGLMSFCFVYPDPRKWNWPLEVSHRGHWLKESVFSVVLGVVWGAI